MIGNACGLVEIEIKTQQKAATLMQKLARGVWGRRRIRRLRVISSSREVLRAMVSSHEQLEMAPMLKRRQAFPPFTLQWRLFVLLHRFQTILSSTPEYQKALAPPQALGGDPSPIRQVVMYDIRNCAQKLNDNDLHANDKLDAVLRLTELITHKELVEILKLHFYSAFI